MTEENMEPKEMQSPFDAIKQTDAEGKEWWNSRMLAKTVGYTKYWNFEQLMGKMAQVLQQEKGLKHEEHFVEIEEMAQLGSGTSRIVHSFLLSKIACMAIVTNADKRKPLVSQAKAYFTDQLSSLELSKGLESNVMIYRSNKGKISISVIFNQETFWLSQKRMAELFGTTVSTINYHLKQIDESGEIHLSDAIRKIRIPSDKWDEQGILLYNLDVVIAVGYRVNSYEATQFRMWATQTLKEFIVKGFVMDDERLKGKQTFGYDYFDELLDRIREIRTSERRYYQKITDIYAECSSDYDPKSTITQLFYKTVQNMLHYAVSKKTAAEIVYERVDAEKPHMGLTTWKNAPTGRIMKSDVTIAKNYLSEKEISQLELLSTAFLDMAEARAVNHILMTMNDWKNLLEKFLSLSDYTILTDVGSVSHEEAEAKALSEYKEYLKEQDKTFLSDFDKLTQKLIK
jgi:hypothetical protein